MVIEKMKHGQGGIETSLSSKYSDPNPNLLKTLSENYDERLLDTMAEDIFQLRKEELQSLLKILENLNASRRRDPTAERVSFRRWVFEHFELFPQTSQLLEEVGKSPSSELVKELTDLVKTQLENYFEEDEYFEEGEY